jgi:MoaA/NifB/PqqE/SkfB family radical SAM enzyme
MDPDDLEAIAELGVKLGVERVYVYFTLLSGHLFDKPEENLSLEERETFRRRFNGRKRLRLEFPTEAVPCNGGGARHMAVMPTGDATFCPPVPYSYGNIRSRTLEECLKDIRADYRRFQHCTGQCPVNFLEYRRGCRARFMYEQPRSASEGLS